MAGLAQGNSDASEIADWMTARWRDVSFRPEADAAGRELWASSIRDGRAFVAPRPADVLAMGFRAKGGQDPTPTALRRASPRPSPTVKARTHPPLDATPRSRPADDLRELRRQQAQFAKVVHAEGAKDSWMLAPVLAPVALIAGLEGAALVGGRAIASKVQPPPLSFAEREAWQATNEAMRRAARAKFTRANGIPAGKMSAEVHHSRPLEWKHVFPNVDPNDLANLWPLRPMAHEIASAAWRAFRASLNGRNPSQVEVMAEKLRIDELVAPYLRWPGVPRSRTPPKDGGLT